MTAVDTCAKNRGTFSNLQILHPAVFCFKEEGILAENPLICHNQGVFGCPESAKKMKEKGEVKSRNGGTESFPRKFITEVIDVYNP